MMKLKDRKKYSMFKILLLEDDISLIDGLEYSLQKNNFAVETVRTTGEALKRLHSVNSINQYDLLLLDVTLPDGTGFDVCKKVRETNSQIPIVFLTASDEEVNVIRGLDGLSVLLVIRGPIRKIHAMSIVDTINAQ